MAMYRRLTGGAALSMALIACMVSLPPAARAEDFFSALFGAFGARPPASSPRIALPFANEGSPPEATARVRASYGGGQAWCVRTCDGRYFPINGPDKAGACNHFCPASKTEIVYGGDIDHAATESGKSYSELPNAFRYRNEIVAGCTCTGAATGLAPVSIANDPTLRKGDIVADTKGLVVANRDAGRNKSAAVNFTPAPRSIQARFRQVRVMASE